MSFALMTSFIGFTEKNMQGNTYAANMMAIMLFLMKFLSQISWYSKAMFCSLYDDKIVYCLSLQAVISLQMKGIPF